MQSVAWARVPAPLPMVTRLLRLQKGSAALTCWMSLGTALRAFAHPTGPVAFARRGADTLIRPGQAPYLPSQPIGAARAERAVIGP